MIRILAFLAMWLFVMATFYRAIAPAIESLVSTGQGAMSTSGPLSTALLGDVESALLIYIPLIATAGVILMAYLLAVGQRGTSFRP
jgi:phosphotransferase system  glucose/maltose/N-acetylglucosamine-specific IIC component